MATSAQSSLFGSAAQAVWPAALSRKPLEDAADDEVIFNAAGRFPSIVVLTKDADFVDIARRKGPPPKVIWLRCPNLRTMRLINVLRPRLAEALEAVRRGLPLVELVIEAAE